MVLPTKERLKVASEWHFYILFLKRVMLGRDNTEMMNMC